MPWEPISSLYPIRSGCYDWMLCYDALKEPLARFWRQPLLLGFTIMCANLFHLTCREDHILWYELVVHDGKLGQLYPLHSRHRMVTSTPIELDIIRRVAIWGGQRQKITSSEYMDIPALLKFRRNCLFLKLSPKSGPSSPRDDYGQISGS